MVVVTVEEAKDRLAELLAGGEEVVICQDSIAVGRLVPTPGDAPQRKQRQLGLSTGKAIIAPDFDAPLDDFVHYN